MMTATTPEALLDLDRYPIDRPESDAGKALIAACQADLERSGACVLDGFLRPQAVTEAVEEVAGVLDQAFYKIKHHNVYLSAEDPAFDSDHPRNRSEKTDSATLAYDLFPTDCRLDRIYRWQPLQAFVATVLGFQALHPYSDPLSPLNILVYPPGCQTGWHFDNANFVVTFMLQTSEAGGAYEYVPFIRDEAAENYDTVGHILEGDASRTQVLEQGPGALVLFKGKYTLHRVTPVEGERQRLIAVFSYAPEPGHELTEHTRKIFYGRAA